MDFFAKLFRELENDSVGKIGRMFKVLIDTPMFDGESI